MTRVLLQGQKDLSSLNWSEDCKNLRDRIRFLRGLDPENWPDVSDDALLHGLKDWLGPFATGARSNADLGKIDLLQAIKAMVGYIGRAHV